MGAHLQGCRGVYDETVAKGERENFLRGKSGGVGSEGSAEDIALKAAGYARVPYGIRMVYNATNVDVSANWTSGPAGTLGGYSKADYLAKKPVRYLQPIPSATIAYSNYQIPNSYGFGNE